MGVKPEIILGPPGTGKTTTLLEMVDSELMSGVPPDRIGYVSFTKKAALEATERACEKFSLSRSDLPFFRTLHSMCFQTLGMSNADVFEGKKIREFGDWIGVRLSEHRAMDDSMMSGFTDGDRALFMENLARVTCTPLRQLYDRNDDNLSWSLVERLSMALQKYKEKNELYDYTDMLTMFCRSDWSPHLEVLFVDEAQDLSQLQWDVVWKLANRCRRVVIAGDDDQAIYRWAGAAVQYFVDLEGDVRVLGQSWRVPPSIQEVSSDIIRQVRNRRPKTWSPCDRSGTVSRVRDIDEIDFWGEDILVLARNTFLLKPVEEELRKEGVIFEARGHSSVRRSVLESIRIWERLRSGHMVTVDEVRSVYSLMSSGSGVRRGYKQLPGLSPDQSVSMSWLQESGGLMRDDIWHFALDRIPEQEKLYILRARQKGEKTTGRPRVRLSTIHGAKGGEAEHVVVISDMATRTYREMLDSPEDEARVWYVASTRARDRLSIVSPRTRNFFEL